MHTCVHIYINPPQPSTSEGMNLYFILEPNMNDFCPRTWIQATQNTLFFIFSVSCDFYSIRTIESQNNNPGLLNTSVETPGSTAWQSLCYRPVTQNLWLSGSIQFTYFRRHQDITSKHRGLDMSGYDGCYREPKICRPPCYMADVSQPQKFLQNLQHHQGFFFFWDL